MANVVFYFSFSHVYSNIAQGVTKGLPKATNRTAVFPLSAPSARVDLHQGQLPCHTIDKRHGALETMKLL